MVKMMSGDRSSALSSQLWPRLSSTLIEESSSLLPNFEMAISSVRFHFLSASCTSIHGILALKADFHLKICNPSTEQVISLTPDTKNFVGYDPIDDQHKVLSTESVYHQVLEVLTLGGSQGWRRIKSTIPPYFVMTTGVCINGFVYFGAYSPERPTNPGIVCFDVRFEKLSYVKAPEIVVTFGKDVVFFEYKGKLASVVRDPYCQINIFHLWILEDIEKHEWSKQTCVLPLSLLDFFGGVGMSFPGTNKAGELIIAPKNLSRRVQPFYIFYYNVETKNIRRVRLLGIGDNEEFRHCYGFEKPDECYVRIAPHHVESIAFFKDPTSIQGSKCKRG